MLPNVKYFICLLDDRLELKGVSWKGFNIKKNKSEVTLEEIRGFVEKMLSTEGFFSEDIKDQLKEKLPNISFSKYQKYLPLDLKREMLFDYLNDFDIEKVRNFQIKEKTY